MCHTIRSSVSFTYTSLSSVSMYISKERFKIVKVSFCLHFRCWPEDRWFQHWVLQEHGGSHGCILSIISRLQTVSWNYYLHFLLSLISMNYICNYKKARGSFSFVVQGSTDKEWILSHIKEKAHENTPWANTAWAQRTPLFVYAGVKGECCSPCSLMLFQSDSTGKLGFHEFKHLWDNVKKWQASRMALFICQT